MQYNIPENYNNQGKILNGLLEIRNCIEAIIFGYAGYYVIFKILPMTTVDRFIAYGVVVLPIVIFLVIGVGGDSVMQKLHIIRKFKRSRRQLHYSLVEGGNTREGKSKHNKSGKKKAKRNTAAGKKKSA